MYDLNDHRSFVQAVDHGGFAAAARALGIPKSTISRRVLELESRLGVRLIERTSRRFVPTAVGLDFYQHARAMLIEAEAAESIVALCVLNIRPSPRDAESPVREPTKGRARYSDSISRGPSFKMPR